MKRAVLEFKTPILVEAGLLNPRIFRSNRRLEVLQTFNFDAEHTTQILRLDRRPGMEDLGPGRDLDDLLARYSLDSLEVLGRDDGESSLTVLVRLRNSDGLQGILREVGHDVFPTTPCVLEEERCTVSLGGPPGALERVLGLLPRMGLPFTVKSLGPFRPGAAEGPLTRHQRDLLRLALQLGYYEIPRRCDLGRLAAIVGVSATAVGKALRRAEKAIVGGFVAREGALG
jgi:hypothetical protein